MFCGKRGRPILFFLCCALSSALSSVFERLLSSNLVHGWRGVKVYISSYVLWKGRKTHSVLSLLCPFFITFIYVWKASIVKSCPWLKRSESLYIFLRFLEREEDPLCSSSIVPFLWHFHLCLRGFYHQIVSMVEEEEVLIATNVEIARKSLLPLQDPWYSSSPLFLVVPTDIGVSNAPYQWNIRVKPLILKLYGYLRHLGLWICASNRKSFCLY